MYQLFPTESNAKSYQRNNREIFRKEGNSPPKGQNVVVYVHGLHYLHSIKSADKKSR